MNALKLPALSLVWLVFASLHLYAGEKKPDIPPFTTISPVVYTYYGSSIHYDFSIQLQPENISSRTRTVIIPEICIANGTRTDTLRLEAIVLEGKLYHHLRLRNGNLDAYDSLAVRISPELERKRHFSGFFPSTPDTRIVHTSIHSFNTSCCEYHPFPNITLSSMLRNFGGDRVILPPVDKEIRNKEEAITENIKWRKVSGKAFLHFKINEHKIDLALGNNRAQIQQMTDIFRKVITDPYARFDSAFIKGQASPDGGVAFNTKLALRRSQDALRFLKHELDSLKLPYIQKQFRTSYLPEAWDELYQKIEENPRVPDKEKVLKIIRNTPKVEERKYLLKRMKRSFAFLRDSILGNIRRVDYEFYFTFKDLTPQEQRELLYERPDVYVPADFLAVEGGTSDSAQKINILHIAYKQYPNNTHILQNLLAEYIRQGKWEDAASLTDSIDVYPHCLMESGFLRNYTILCLHREAYTQLRELDIRLLEAYDKLNENLRKEIYYGLGLAALKQYQFHEAYEYLKTFRNDNTVLALRGLGRDEEADTLAKEIRAGKEENNSSLQP